DIVLVADLPDPGKIIVLRNHQTPGALNGLREECRNGVGALTENRPFQFIRGGTALTDRGVLRNITVWVRGWNVDEARNLRTEHRPKTRYACGVHCTNGHAVISMLAADDLVFVRLSLAIKEKSNSLDRGVVGVAATG